MSSSVRDVGKKVRLRLVLPCALFILISSIDRANVSFASLTMNQALGFSAKAYGLGAGLFFTGYLLSQYPSVALFRRIGMARWLAAISMTWGVAAASLAFVSSIGEFYALRIVIGLAEGGLSSGIMLYLARWAAEEDRATILALPVGAVPLSLIIGAPLSGLLMDAANPLGMEGWRWMFLVEGLPAIAMSVFALLYFPERIPDARWLDADEKTWLAARVPAETASGTSAGRSDFKGTLTSPAMWLCSLIWFGVLAGNYGIIFWLPQAIAGMKSLTPSEVGLIVAMPWTATLVTLYLVARSSDRSGERFIHLAVPAAVAGLAILGAASLGASPLAVVLLVIAGAGLGGALAPVWAIPISLLPPQQRAPGVVVINVIGSTAGLVVPALMGVIREASGSFILPTLLLTGLLLLAAIGAFGARAMAGSQARMAA